MLPGTSSTARLESPSGNREGFHAEPGRDLPQACASSQPSQARRATRTVERLASLPPGNTGYLCNPKPHPPRKRKDALAVGILRLSQPDTGERRRRAEIVGSAHFHKN